MSDVQAAEEDEEALMGPIERSSLLSWSQPSRLESPPKRQREVCSMVHAHNAYLFNRLAMPFDQLEGSTASKRSNASF